METYLQTDKFLSVKKYMALSSKKKYEQSDLYKNEQQFIQQKNSSNIKNYRIVLKHKAYNDYKNLANTEKLKEFEETELHVKSGKVEKARQEMNKKDFKASGEFKLSEKYKKLLSSKEIRNYRKIVSLPQYRDFINLQHSHEIEAFDELEKYILSAGFKQEKKKIETSRFADTPEFAKEKEFIALKKSAYFRNNFKFKSSSKYSAYLKTKDSEKLKKYESLKEYINTEAFKKVKEYMLLPGEKKYRLSEEYQKEQRYLELKKSEKIKWYLKTKDSKKFDDLKQWQLTFNEDFESPTLDRKKWMTKYFWGETILHDTYSLAHEKQYFSDGKNLEIQNSILKIITRNEKATGKAWNPQLGFFPKEFSYTSGLISTGNYFRQKYGVFEAKIRFNRSFPVNHAFWMLSDRMLPHVDVAKSQNKLVMSNIWGNITEKNGVRKYISKLSLGKLANDFFIYRLEWTNNRLTWKINNVTVASTTDGVPQEMMYIVLSSALYEDVNGTVLPAAMEVDWVKSYQRVG
ncbi:MAG: family 16 glycosylhydrolase [Bacteroidales bacterium]|nr:family 16 glycosylhydrolase [Bacteroidales bacterium]